MVSEHDRIAFLAKKLDELKKKEEELLDKLDMLYLQWQQLEEDKELLEVMIMHQHNKQHRRQNVVR